MTSGRSSKPVGDVDVLYTAQTHAFTHQHKRAIGLQRGCIAATKRRSRANSSARMLPVGDDRAGMAGASASLPLVSVSSVVVVVGLVALAVVGGGVGCFSTAARRAAAKRTMQPGGRRRTRGGREGGETRPEERRRSAHTTAPVPHR